MLSKSVKSVISRNCLSVFLFPIKLPPFNIHYCSMITDQQSSSNLHFRLPPQTPKYLSYLPILCHLLVTLVILVLDKSWNHLHLRLMLLPADANILGLPSIQSTGTEEELVRGTILIDKTMWHEKNLSLFGPCLTLNEQTDAFAQFWFWTDLALIFPAVRWSGIPVELFYQNQKFWRL